MATRVPSTRTSWQSTLSDSCWLEPNHNSCVFAAFSRSLHALSQTTLCSELADCQRNIFDWRVVVHLTRRSAPARQCKAHSNGPRPTCTGDRRPPYETYCVRSARNKRIHPRTVFVRPNVASNLCSSMSWSTQSKAAERSSKPNICHPRTSAWRRCFCRMLLSVCTSTDDEAADRSRWTDLLPLVQRPWT